LGITVIWVTHDQAEAFTVADRLAVLLEGSIAQVDAPSVIKQHPANSAVAHFLGLPNLDEEQTP
jgi:ABC-type sugar transport system ATPase subunit